MKPGKIPENVLKRSVLKQIHMTRSEVRLGAAVGEDCAAVKLQEDETFVLSSDPVIWRDAMSGKCAVHGTLNDLATSGAEPVGLLLTAMLPADIEEPPGEAAEAPETLAEDGSYTTKEDVALYIHTYGHLPGNFITKKEAQALGWSGGSLEPYAPGKCIGGSRFGNYEGLLPEAEGRTYTECDINTLGADKRGAERIVFSNDGLIYYTGDHYESFELLYGEE